MIINVKVRPNSREEKIEKISEKDYIICVKELPEKGKANKRVIRLLSKKFRVSSRKIYIKNPLSRKKIVEINLNIS